MLKFHSKRLRSAYEIFNKALNVTPKTLTKCRLICVTQHQQQQQQEPEQEQQRKRKR